MERVIGFCCLAIVALNQLHRLHLVENGQIWFLILAVACALVGPARSRRSDEIRHVPIDPPLSTYEE